MLLSVEILSATQKKKHVHKILVLDFNIHLPRIQKDYIGDLNKDLLKEVGITAIGDIMAILRQIKKQNQVGVLYINRHDILEVNNICYEFFKYRGAAVKVMKTTLNHPQPKRQRYRVFLVLIITSLLLVFFSV